VQSEAPLFFLSEPYADISSLHEQITSQIHIHSQETEIARVQYTRKHGSHWISRLLHRLRQPLRNKHQPQNLPDLRSLRRAKQRYEQMPCDKSNIRNFMRDTDSISQTPPARQSPQLPSPQPSLHLSAHAYAPTCKNMTRARSKPMPLSTTLARNAATLRHATTPSNCDLPTRVARSSTLARSARINGTRTTDRRGNMRILARSGRVVVRFWIQS
jgi:hypothetical protein